MKLFVLALLVCAPAFAAYTAVYTITTDHTQAGTADSTNYPVLVSRTIAGLKTTGNGGYLTNASGYDHVYTSDAGCTTNLKWDSVLYVGTTGQIVDHVLLTTLHHSTNDTFYLCAGNAAITTFQGNRNATWPVYAQVLHLAEASNPYNDSTGNGFNSTAGTYPTQVAGLFGFAQSFVTGSSQYIQTTDSVSTGSTVSITGWMKTSSTAQLNVLFDSRGNGSRIGCVAYTNAATGNGEAYCNNTTTIPDAVNLADGNWHYFAITTSGGTMSSYVDGALVSTSGGVAGNNSGTANIGASTDSTRAYATGTIQEIRYVNGLLPSSWITADWNSQKPSSAFLTIGIPAVSGGNAMPFVALAR